MNKSIQKVIAVFALAAILLALPGTLMAQTVAVSGRCITGTITLTVDPGSPLNGKVWYSGTGTVLGFPGVIVNIYWDNGVNRWYLDFDGQAYFENADNTTLPPSTNSGTWVPTVDNTDCITGAPLSITRFRHRRPRDQPQTEHDQPGRRRLVQFRQRIARLQQQPCVHH